MDININKKVNLSELLQTAWEEDFRERTFLGDKKTKVYFDSDGYVTVSQKFTSEEEFDVTTSKSVDKDTILNRVDIVINNSGVGNKAESLGKLITITQNNVSINGVLNNNPNVTSIIYTDDRGIATTIWSFEEVKEIN
ncbi:hypothetical protein RNT41_05275 [Staphylococcus pseudintermedius]|uniref:hypothetical protein n=1 Tax=Staphylococcus pseudintermedius TaxID=283734 RepID=UPI001A076078|nr:hypothetical protein [Staphylococcus pseudintermedius]EGQ3936117.1 hypothetical protein [Staphylococcus pseudintermedius]EHT3695496.1 hypothetical protein [Staphylococcus pseudintermedius]EJA1920283.1 hypothetical protein [Staphylococcus pseudintermedius]EMB9425995.1 hypothetical protein [Staphylococcus pseudintermedius]MDT0939359.1 hypothetical protein [Staphylococcus pseudintermedius]